MNTIITNEWEYTHLNDGNYRHIIIDTYLLYWGRIQRKDLARHLGVGNVTATRIFSDYSSKNPGVLLINPAKKAYVYTASFKSLTLPSPESVLPLLAYGIEQKKLTTSCYGPTRPGMMSAPLCAKKVSAITRAMISCAGIEMSYISGTSGLTKRCVYPHSVFNGGGTWYFRGYDSKSDSFRTFRFSRIESVGKESPALERLKTFKDDEWNGMEA